MSVEVTFGCVIRVVEVRSLYPHTPWMVESVSSGRGLALCWDQGEAYRIAIALSRSAHSPHAFIGRLDRTCDLCGRVDRHEIHRGHTTPEAT